MLQMSINMTNICFFQFSNRSCFHVASKMGRFREVKSVEEKKRLKRLRQQNYTIKVSTQKSALEKKFKEFVDHGFTREDLKYLTRKIKSYESILNERSKVQIFREYLSNSESEDNTDKSERSSTADAETSDADTSDGSSDAEISQSPESNGSTTSGTRSVNSDLVEQDFVRK
jgi:hypothetical protein